MKRLIILSLFVALILGVAFSAEAKTWYVATWGNDNGPGTKEEPWQRPKLACEKFKQLASPGDALEFLEGIWDYSEFGDDMRLKIKGMYGTPGKLLEIRGEEGKVVRFRGYTDPWPPEADPTEFEANISAYSVLGVADSKYVKIKNLRLEGAYKFTLEINANYETAYIEFEGIKAIRGAQHAVRINGKNVHHLIFNGCEFGDNLNLSPSTHAVYVTGGHWNAYDPPFHDIIFFKCHIWGAYRWGIQFNGRFHHIIIDSNEFDYNLMGAVQFIGVQHALVSNNKIDKINKQAFVVYMYYDTKYFGDPDNPEDVKFWKETHWTNKNINFVNNTIQRPEEQWTDIKPSYKPKFFYDILLSKSEVLNKPLIALPDFTGIKIVNNIVTGPSNGLFIKAEGTDLNAPHNIFNDNIAYSYGLSFNNVWVDNNGYEDTLQQFDAIYDNWDNNMVENPLYLSLNEIFIPAGKYNWEELLLSYEKNNLHIKPGSPAIDTVKKGKWQLSYDLDLNKRPQGKAVDRGAYEYVNKNPLYEGKPNIQNAISKPSKGKIKR